MNILLDILLALPLLGVVWALLRNGVVLVSLLKAAVLLGVLFAAVAFIRFPESWTEGSLLYGQLRHAVDFVRGVCAGL